MSASLKDSPPSDSELLAAYVNGSEHSFREFVHRHSGWVFASALRQLKNPQQAEDATQAVFVILCKRARALASHPRIPGWLFNTTHYCVLAIQRGERRRQIHERRAAMQRAETSTEPPALSGDLDDAVAKLPSKERNAIIMRFYRGMEFEQVATTLGISEFAARKRVNRAVSRLRSRLGEAVSAGSLSLAALHGLPTNAILLSTHISQAAMGAASGVPVAGGAAAVTKGAVFLMATTQMKIAAAVAVSALLLTGVGMTAWSLRHDLARPAQNAEALDPSSPSDTEVTAAPTDPFADVYKAPAGRDDVMRIVPPFIDARAEFYQKSFLGQQHTLPNLPDALPDAMIVVWRNGTPQVEGTMYNGGRGYSVTDLAQFLLNVYPPDVEGPPALLKRNVTGDFVLKASSRGETQSDWRRGLERTLSNAFGREIKMNFQGVDRPVYVLRGKFAGKNPDGTPWSEKDPAANRIEISGLKSNGKPIGGSCTGDATQLAQWIGRWINQTVIIEATGAPSVLSWNENAGEGEMDSDINQQVHDPDLVIKHIEEQTGLTATQETRKVRRLFVDWR